MDVAALFRASTRLSEEPLLLVARDGTIVAANPAAAAALGVPAAELPGRPFADVGASREELSAYLRLASGSTDPVPGAVLVDNAAGATRFACTAALYSVEHGDLVVLKLRARGKDDAFVLLGQKVAELNEEVQRRRRLEQHLEIVTDSLPVLVSYVDRDLRYTFVNRAYERWFDVPREQLLGKHVAEVLGDEAFQRTRAFTDAVLRGERVELEAHLPYRRGGARHVRASLVPHVGASGAVEGYVALVSDVSREKRAAEAARFLGDATATLSSSLDYDATLSRVAHAAVPTLAHGCAVYLLDGAHAIREVAVAHVDAEKIRFAAELRERHPPDRDAPRGVAHVVRTGDSELVPYVSDDMLAASARDDEHLRLMRSLGIRSWLCVPLRAGARVIGAIAFVRDGGDERFDASDVALAEELGRRAAIAVENGRLYALAQEAVRKRDDFLAVASHELKTPLTSMDLYVSGLLRAVQREQSQEVLAATLERGLRKIDAQVGRLKELVEQLLDVSRMTAARLPLYIEDVDLVEVVRDVVSRLEEESRRQGAPVSLALPDRLVGRWDRSRLDQVVTNLVVNALKYGRGEPVEVTLRRDGAAAILAVKDHGIGIEASEHERIFGRFERAVSVRNFGGLGLGLWIVHEIVQGHRGRVRVESAPGEGSLFVVELPLRAAEEHAAAAHDVGR